jgi:hypothetical protein
VSKIYSFSQYVVCFVILTCYFCGSAAKAVLVDVQNASGKSECNDTNIYPDSVYCEIEWINDQTVTIVIHLTDKDREVIDNTRVITFQLGAINHSGSTWTGFHTKLVGGPTWRQVHFSDRMAWDVPTDIAWDLDPARNISIPQGSLPSDPKPVSRKDEASSDDLGFDPPIPSPGELSLGRLDRNDDGGVIDLHQLKSGDSFTIILSPTPPSRSQPS